MGLSDRQREVLAAMGITPWELRGASREEAEPEAVSRGEAGAAAGIDVGEELEALAEEVASCTRCGLHESRTHTVFGVGNPQADWLFVGEAPGRDEDLQGLPFVGRAGQLLTRMIQALGLSREEVYIANVLKCRPPNNRDPLPEEVAACEPYLHRQLELIAPRIIVALGRVSAQALLKTKRPLGRLRGETYRYGPAGVPLVVTYHPAYLLRSPLEKRKAWEDLRRARVIVAAAGKDGEAGAQA